MKEQIPFRKAVGKTVEKIGGSECDPSIIILWTDGTFSALHLSGYVAGEVEWEDMALSLEPHPAWKSAQLWWPAKLVELGIASDVEIKEAQTRATAAQEAMRDAQERARFEELRAKFEGAT